MAVICKAKVSPAKKPKNADDSKHADGDDKPPKGRMSAGDEVLGLRFALKANITLITTGGEFREAMVANRATTKCSL